MSYTLKISIVVVLIAGGVYWAINLGILPSGLLYFYTSEVQKIDNGEDANKIEPGFVGYKEYQISSKTILREGEVYIPAVILRDPGFAVVYERSGQQEEEARKEGFLPISNPSPENIIGVSKHLSAGRTNDIQVEINQEDSVSSVGLYSDNGDKIFEADEDTPITFPNGDLVLTLVLTPNVATTTSPALNEALLKHKVRLSQRVLTR